MVYKALRCSVCNHPQREDIETKILSGEWTQREICSQYGISEPALSVHKNKHMLHNVKEKLQLAIQSAILKGIEPSNVGELVRLMDYVRDMEEEKYLTAKDRWYAEVQGKYQSFKEILNHPMLFSELDSDTKNTISAIAKLCFLEPEPNLEKFIKSYLEGVA
jgi:hypothetical protein